MAMYNKTICSLTLIPAMFVRFLLASDAWGLDMMDI